VKKKQRYFYKNFFFQTSLYLFEYKANIFAQANIKKGMHMLEIQQERFIRLSEVIQRTGLSRSTIYLNISKGEFPKNISLGVRSVGWLESEIQEWMQRRIHQKR